MLRDRARSAAILVPPLLLALWLGGGWILLVVAVATLLGAWEAFRLLTAAGLSSMPLLGIVLAVVIALGDSVKVLPGGSGLLLASIGVVLLGIGALTRLDPREGLVVFAITTFGALYVGMLGFVARLSSTDAFVDRSAILGWLGQDRAWILALVLVVWAFDTAAYFAGRRFGSRPFMHHVSPAKTMEGVVGGLVAAALVGALLLVAFGRPALAGAVFGLIVGAAAQAGDLVESMLKRAAGAKESGHLIPGHGGLLDRIDSFLFAAPVAYFYVVAVLR
ncbi:MAG TPA: phosphatidate cytidylyltransferase [Patescibacteria group bacterium]|jgi:phosphatidate cytidylyltransferase|nr:phosphatidate cytidylyltransferase [Patescibacteria group bacterium]